MQHPTTYIAALAVTGALVLTAAAAAQAQSLSKLEQRCSKKTAKAAAKLAQVRMKELGRCLQDAAGEPGPPACPTATNGAKIAKAEAKIVTAVNKSCGSTCSVSIDVTCLAGSLCPPLETSAEQCSGGAKSAPFDIGSLGFPGPFCESVIGGPILRGDDLAQCVSTLTTQVSDVVIDVVYGDTASGAALGKSELGCLRAIGKSVEKLVFTIQKGVGKCRDKIGKGKVTGNPTTCASDDAKLEARISKARTKVADAIERSCSASDVAALDLCGTGIGATTSIDAAQDCLVAAASELADSSVPPALRQYSPTSLIDAVYPPAPVCGDDVVNQGPNAFLLLGEECDGVDDAACPGDCFPPGDLFECTCATTARLRYIADGASSDLDLGWTGTSHDQHVADFSGYVTDVSGCDCSELTDATCTGVTSDSVCTLTGQQNPTCSWDVGSATGCDQHGNGNGQHQDADCYVCDAFSDNPGTYCADESDCMSRCYDAVTTVAGSACTTQSDCPTGQICRGRCDRSASCLIVPYSAPVPISSGGTPVCSVIVLASDVVGTHDIVTGEHALEVHERSLTHLGISTSVPCPVCGGFCVGGGKSGALCAGTCAISGAACRFDSDCDPGEACTTDSPDCPGNAFCNLSLVCGGGSPGAVGIKEGHPCRIEASSPVFGTVSNDCPPPPNLNVTGDGLHIDFEPQTSESVLLAPSTPCTQPGYELFDCECPDDGGRKTQPNLCNPACNAGPELGNGCADGNTSGLFTTCSAGPNAGRACDEDGDCPGSACDANPRHCTGDPSVEHHSCSVDADCGTGTCVDACPSGRCVPLCVPKASDPFEGECAAGPPFHHCDGPFNSFRGCSAEAAAAGCDATCSGSATSCTSDASCPSGESCTGPCEIARGCEAGDDGQLGNGDDHRGAGVCIADTTRCFVQPLSGEGGDVGNGNGDSTNVYSAAAFCIESTTNTAANAVTGVGGPGRLRVHGVNVPNFTALPTVGACCTSTGVCNVRASMTCVNAGDTFVGGGCSPNPCP